MNPIGPAFLVVALLTLAAFYIARRRALALVEQDAALLHSLPGHYGFFVLITTALPAVFLLVAWIAFGGVWADSVALGDIAAAYPGVSEAQAQLHLTDLKNWLTGDILGDLSPELAPVAQAYANNLRQGAMSISLVAVVLALAGLGFGLLQVKPVMRARNRVETVVRVSLVASSVVAILVTLGIILSLAFETVLFFRLVPISEFLFGLEWSPQIALRADQVGSSGAFGAIPLFTGTLLITFIAMLVAVPVGLLSAIFMTQYASSRLRDTIKPILEILAGVPTVVYGFFAALTVAPVVRDLGVTLGLDVSSESALVAGAVMGIMIIPFMSSLSDDALLAVPQAMRDGSFAMGATKSETIRRVLLPAALPGIMGAFLLSVSRAIGETMIVVMAAGLSANLTGNPLEAVTTVTVQIVTLLTGDQEFDSAKTLAAFALGLTLFIVTLGLNVLALRTVRKYREQYE